MLVYLPQQHFAVPRILCTSCWINMSFKTISFLYTWHFCIRTCYSVSSPWCVYLNKVVPSLNQNEHWQNKLYLYHVPLHFTAGASKIWIESESGLGQAGKIIQSSVVTCNVCLRERHCGRGLVSLETALTIYENLEGTDNSKSHLKLWKVKNMTHFVCPSLFTSQIEA